jgi:hypothetical protein
MIQFILKIFFKNLMYVKSFVGERITQAARLIVRSVSWLCKGQQRHWKP